MTRRCVIVLATALTLWPGVAYAGDWDFWAWLEQLSGPGPFHGWVVSAPLFCVNDQAVVPCSGLRSAGHQRVVLTIGRFSSGDHLRFKDLPDTPENRESVHVLVIGGTYMFRVHPAVEVGPGVGLMHFSGNGFDGFNRLTLTPVKVSVMPLRFVPAWKGRRWSEVLRLEVEDMLVTKGFKGADFGNTSTGFSAGREFLTRAGLVVDVGALFWRD